VHEFLHTGWQPLYVTELRAAVREIGLFPVGSATLAENFDAWVLTDEATALLAEIADPEQRELVRDFFLGQRFRADVFARDCPRLAEDERTARLAGAAYCLARPARTIAYRTRTARGRVRYDTQGARSIVANLADGPRRLDAAALVDILNLCAAGDILPVETGAAPVDRINRAIFDRLDGTDEILWLALPCGTALPVERDLLRGLRAGDLDDSRFPGWREFLAAHGL